MALIAGSVVAALFSLRSIEGAVPGRAAILGLAANGDTFLLGTADGAFTSSDGWRWSRVEGISGRTLVADTNDGAVLVSGRRLYTTADLTSLSPAAGDVPEPAALAATPDGDVYLVTAEGRFYRQDGGEGFRELEAGEAPNEVLALAADAGEPPELLAGGLSSGLWRSEDGGVSWTRLLGTPSRAAMFDTRVAGRAFLATAGGVLVSSDGLAWDFTGLREPVETLAQSRESYFAITASRLVYVSSDGQEWQPLALE